MTDRETVDIPLPGGRTYRLEIQPDDLHSLATGILSHLGCSFETTPEPSDQYRAAQAKDRKRYQAQVHEDGERYATEHTPFGEEIPQEIVQERLADAYRNGWLNAPKPVTFPLKHRGTWTP